MGHMILIAEELVKFLERSPEDLLHIVQQSFVRSEWEAFVQGSLRETKDKDARPLAGGKPMLSAVPAEPNKEESDEGSSDEEDSVKFGEPLSRTSAGDENRFKRGGFGYSGSDGGDDDEEVGQKCKAEADERHGELVPHVHDRTHQMKTTMPIGFVRPVVMMVLE